jgi:predicted ATPase
MIGRTVSHYRILEKLGQGGMGVVYKAEDAKLKRTVALKFLPPEFTRDAEVKERFIHEAQAASALDHPNICTIYEVSETEDDQTFIAMACYEGESLKSKIERGPLKINEAIDIAVQIAQGLAKAHGQGIIHRDVKPANILITKGGLVKIVDFGLAKLAGRTVLTKTSSTLGTVAYMSPEQARGSAVDHRTDIWSLGVVLYEMLAGHRPFRNEYDQALIYCILNEDPEPITSLRDDVPVGLEEIVIQAMAKPAAERYERVDDMLIDLRMLVAESASNVRQQLPCIEAQKGPGGSRPLPLPGREEITVEAPRPVFVAREHELGKLGMILDKALSGHGQVVFVTGEAGDGKTALINEFARRAQETDANLGFARGNCNAHTGIGDPYLPFREILSLLTGDVQDKCAAGVITTEHATRLWNLMPRSVEALLDIGPDLIDTFVSGSALVSRAASFSSGRETWVSRLKKFVERKAAVPADSTLQQSSLFEQYSRVMQRLARENPLLLVLDDLQWADAGSISLLFHLGRRIEGSPILIIGAYRPAEIAGRRDGERHPLDHVINEFRRTFGDLEVRLGQVEDRHFVDAVIDAEPNLLDTTFRDTLFHQTRGHPLFTIELLRGMQEQGALTRDSEGRWVEGRELNWNALPARVDAVIEERISHLPDESRDMLTLASVEGDEFTAQVVAALQKIDVGAVIHHLSGELDRRHHLVTARGSKRVGTLRLSRYMFQHTLFQRYLYNSLDEVECAHLHEQVGNLLESLYGEETEEIAIHLARHFQEAGVAEKAIDYMLLAGKKAVKLSANEEAIAHFSRALELLESLPESAERVEKELTLQLAIIVPLQAARGFASPRLGKAAARARELCRRVDNPPQLFTALAQLSTVYATCPEYRTALSFVEPLNEIAKQINDPMPAAIVHYVRLWPLLNVAELEQASGAAEGMIAFYDPEKHGNIAYLYGYDFGALAYGFGSWVQWMLGYPDRALKWLNESILIARKLNHPFTLAFSLLCGCELHWFLRDLQMVNRYTEELVPLSAEKGFVYWEGHGIFYRGERKTLEGQIQQGIAEMRRGLAIMRGTGTETCLTRLLARMADACMKMGQLDEGLAAIEEAMGFVQRFDERYMEAELHRLKGELFLLQGKDETDAESCFVRAIDVSRGQKAKSWELRAAMSLSRLRLRQGRCEEGRQLLGEAYHWFTEGLETADLREAGALLEKMNS